MRDIVATIQADQYHLIARDPEPALVIQGGPGTGKTAVGLHRASFLLYAHRERAAARARGRAEPGLHGVRLARPPHARRGQRRPARGRRARAGRRADARRPARRAAPEGGHAPGRSRAPGGRGRVCRRAAGAGRAAGGPLRRRRGGRGRRAARRGARGARPDRRRARALPDERAAPLLRGLRRPARRPGLPELRGGRARAAAGRAPDEVPRRVVAGAQAGAGRAPAARLTRGPCRRKACSTRASGGSCAGRGAAGARPTCRCSTRRARSWSRRRPATGT